MINYNDPTEYLWEIKIKRKIPFLQLLFFFLLFVFMPILFFGMLKLVALLSLSVAKGLAIFFLFGTLFLLMGGSLGWVSFNFLIRRNAKMDDSFDESEVSMPGPVVEILHSMGNGAFALFTGTVLYCFSENIFSVAQYFEGSIDRSGQWILFYLDSLIGVITFDIVNIYDLNLSNIAATDQSGKLTHALLNFAIGAGALQLGYNSLKVNQSEVFHGTPKDCYQKLDAYNEKITHFLPDYKVSIIGHFNERETQSFDMDTLYEDLEKQRKSLKTIEKKEA